MVAEPLICLASVPVEQHHRKEDSQQLSGHSSLPPGNSGRVGWVHPVSRAQIHNQPAHPPAAYSQPSPGRLKIEIAVNKSIFIPLPISQITSQEHPRSGKEPTPTEALPPVGSRSFEDVFACGFFWGEGVGSVGRARRRSSYKRKGTATCKDLP